MQHLDYDPQPDGVLRLELSLIDPRGGALVPQDTFDTPRSVRADAVPAAVQSCNAAATDVLAPFLDRVADTARGSAATPK